LDENEKTDTPLTDDELRAQVDTFMFEVSLEKNVSRKRFPFHYSPSNIIDTQTYTET